MYGSRSGISPVMATVILVAIAIVIAIAVAFWATGLVGVFTRFEKIEITAAYAPSSSQIILHVRNTGSSPTTIDGIYINGQPHTTVSIPMTVGASTTITVTGTFTPGVTYEVAVHTASGKLYPAAVLIP